MQLLMRPGGYYVVCDLGRDGPNPAQQSIVLKLDIDPLPDGGEFIAAQRIFSWKPALRCSRLHGSKSSSNPI